MTFADSDCGIPEPHRHTGDIVEGYHIEYWCPSITAWVTDRTRTSYGQKCTCEEPHMKARIQHTMTEIIEILPPEPSLEEWIKSELQKMFDAKLMEHFEYYFTYGEDAYNEWIKEQNDTDHSVEHGSVRDGGDDTTPSGVEVVSEGDGGSPPEG